MYKSQIKQLYRFRYLQRFPVIKEFVNDQEDKDYSIAIDQVIDQMKKKLVEHAEPFKATDPEGYEERLAKAKLSIENLANWAKTENLWEGMSLLHL